MLGMDLGALQEKASATIKHFEGKIGNKDFDEMLFLYMSKISEEIGNLASGVLGREGIKAEHQVSEQELGGVFADTLYSIIILAQKMNINLDRVMDDKINQIETHGHDEGFIA